MCCMFFFELHYVVFYEYNTHLGNNNNSGKFINLSLLKVLIIILDFITTNCLAVY